jgi:hypothetical protein
MVNDEDEESRLRFYIAFSIRSFELNLAIQTPKNQVLYAALEIFDFFRHISTPIRVREKQLLVLICRSAKEPL